MNYLISLFISFSFLSFGGKPLPPAPQIFVYDEASLLSAIEKDQVNQSLTDFETTTGSQMVVALLSTLEGEDLEDFTNRLFRAWKIGDKEKNNGLLLVVAVKDRKFRLEVGYGLEGTIPDSRAKQLTQDYLVPEFKQGRFASGIDALIRNIKNEILRQPLDEISPQRKKKDFDQLIGQISLLLLALAFLVIFTLQSPSGTLISYLLIFAAFSFPLVIFIFIAMGLIQAVLFKIFGTRYMVARRYRGGGYYGSSDPWGGGGWGGSGGGGGGFSGGGGSSGGGGASGSW